ncbi:hypothetical protein C2G38_1313536 [Gigaspora rosea]|uniref:BACK domain-containing protein n=1 Tax=Gigaspora rosea TaxID=44941 RepID=A0A397W2I3_9GLOM|nr:hypothetical protein C2G38_1313536 [Gigaspora rosea]
MSTFYNAIFCKKIGFGVSEEVSEAIIRNPKLSNLAKKVSVPNSSPIRSDARSDLRHNIYNQSFQNDKLQKLHDWCNDIIAMYQDKIFESRDFINLQENALISLIIRDDLQMKEVKIWNNVIEWELHKIHPILKPGLKRIF